MNIQIFGTNKCFDIKKAMSYFKERNIKYLFVDMKKDLARENTTVLSRRLAVWRSC